MKILIRTEAHPQIGAGHLMRCLVLAAQLRSEKCEAAFIVSSKSKESIYLIEQEGYKAWILPEIVAESEVDWQTDGKLTLQVIEEQMFFPAWIIVDHYKLDYRWEALVRSKVKKVMVIDDLANRKHECDLLLDQNYYHNMNKRYNSLIPEGCQTFLGPQYALLRSEFYSVLQHPEASDASINNVLVSFGGGDPTNEIEKVITALSSIKNYSTPTHIIAGPLNKNKLRIRELVKDLPNFFFYDNVNSMADRMKVADLMIGAGGTMTWERYICRLPSIVIATAENQLESSKELASLNAHAYLGFYQEVTTEQIAECIEYYLADTQRCEEIAANAYELVRNNQQGYIAKWISRHSF